MIIQLIIVIIVVGMASGMCNRSGSLNGDRVYKYVRII